MKFSSFSFSPEIQQALQQLDFHTLTPIQQAAIPLVRQGSDVLASAQTGTGKTAAFALPIIQKLLDNPQNQGTTRALVVAPTRELAEQIATQFALFSQFTPLKTVVLFGGVSAQGQAQRLKQGADIIVATAGRLLDHIRLGNATLSHVQHVVLDEADRLLDMGFINDIQQILKYCPEQKQTCLFSATFPGAIKQFAATFLPHAKKVQVNKENSTAQSVTHLVYMVEKRRKCELLSELIGKKNWQQVLVFVNMKEHADQLVTELNLDGISAAGIHGDKKQGTRRRALREFKEGKTRVLVATEVAARGIDITGLPRVINVDVPYLAEDYVHRIGRTGRAGETGVAITFVSREEEQDLFAIEQLIEQKIARKTMTGYEVSKRDKLLADLENRPAHQRRRPRTNRADDNNKKRLINRKAISRASRALGKS